ncbi:hypothetical protein [Thermoleptolyngbya sp.]
MAPIAAKSSILQDEMGVVGRVVGAIALADTPKANVGIPHFGSGTQGAAPTQD